MIENLPQWVWSQAISVYSIGINTVGVCFVVQDRVQFAATMLYAPTTLASVARLIGETLEADYGIDPAPIFVQLGIDTGKFLRPGARVSFARMDKLWHRAIVSGRVGSVCSPKVLHQASNCSQSQR